MNRKSILCICLSLSLAASIALTSCSDTEEDTPSGSSSASYITPSTHAFPSEYVSAVPISSFPEAVSGTYNGQTVTMSLAFEPSIDWNVLNSYKAYQDYRFHNGYARILLATAPGYSSTAYYYYMDKNGNISRGYKYASAFDDDGRALVQFPNTTYAYIDTSEKVVEPCLDHDNAEVPELEWGTDGIDVRQFGEPNAYYQQLYDSEGNLLNEEKFDVISDTFYNGLGVIIKDNKIGLIDTKGNVVIEPSFPFDKESVVYDRGLGRTWSYIPQYSDEDLIIIPTNGKLGVLKITID